MKAIKYFAIGALLTIAGTPAMAQSESEAAVAQVKTILKSGAADADKQIAAIAKPFKKDPKTLTLIGREYLSADNADKAEEYGHSAISKDKSYGEAYILLGDVAIRNDNGGKAAEWFQQAMYMDKTNPEGYRRYAQLMSKSSPATSLSALEELRKNVPGYPVDIIAAQISDRAGNTEKAIEYYGKVDMNKMEKSDLASYAALLYLSGDYDKSLEVALFGAEKEPRFPAFNRLALYNYTEKKAYDEALVYGDRLFNASDSVKIAAQDYQYFGHANLGAKKYDEAIEAFSSILSLEDANESVKLDAMHQIATVYSEKEDYVNAIPALEKYLAAKPNASASDYAELGSMCTYYANSLSGEEQEAAVMKADQVYADLADKFEDAAEFSAFQRARVASIIDPTLEKGAAKPHYDKLIEIITTDGNVEGTSRTRLLQAYQYNMIYALQIQDDVETSKLYANKILELDPENAQALMVAEL